MIKTAIESKSKMNKFELSNPHLSGKYTDMFCMLNRRPHNSVLPVVKGLTIWTQVIIHYCVLGGIGSVKIHHFTCRTEKHFFKIFSNSETSVLVDMFTR